MDEKEFLLLLQRAGITKSRFIGFNIPSNLNQGIPLATQGKCKAVVIRLNKFEIDTDTEIAVPAIYYGDAQRQQYELITGINSQIIFCDDLSEVFVRYTGDEEVNGQIIIYY